MRAKYIKFSDERKKEYCIRTEIIEHNGQTVVRKTPIYKEGEAFVNSYIQKAKLLADVYSNIKIADCRKIDNAVEFEYLDGKSLQKEYELCRTIGQVLELAHKHFQYIIGSDDNITTFYESNESREWFGNLKSFDGKMGLKISNYDAIPSNIYLVNGEAYVTDYEWIFDFTIPLDVVAYHCLLDAYIHCKKLREIVELEQVLRELGIQSSQEKLHESYISFYRNVMYDKEGKGFASAKSACQKPFQTLGTDMQSLRELSDRIRELDTQNASLRKDLFKEKKEHEKCAEYWRQSEEELRRCRLQIDEILKDVKEN